ncbi:hypothetical protein LXL04_031897 [Taraxacum kok-saghyz]
MCPGRNGWRYKCGPNNCRCCKVTTPFRLRVGEERFKHNKEWHYDTLIVIPNDKLLTPISPSTLVTEHFNLADDILRQGARGISNINTIPGSVNVDFADVRAIVANAGSSLVGIRTETANVIYDLVDPTAYLIFGAVIDPSISSAVRLLCYNHRTNQNNLSCIELRHMSVSITLITTGVKGEQESDYPLIQEHYDIITSESRFSLKMAF